MLQCVYSRSLTHTGCEELTVLGKNNGVALAVLNDFVCEKHIGHLRRSRSFARNKFQVIGSLDFIIGLLHEHATEDSAHLHHGSGLGLAAQNNAVLLLEEDGESVVAVIGSNYHLEEYLADFLGCRSLDPLVADNDTSED